MTASTTSVGLLTRLQEIEYHVRTHFQLREFEAAVMFQLAIRSVEYRLITYMHDLPPPENVILIQMYH